MGTKTINKTKGNRKLKMPLAKITTKTTTTAEIEIEKRAGETRERKREGGEARKKSELIFMCGGKMFCFGKCFWIIV